MHEIKLHQAVEKVNTLLLINYEKMDEVARLAASDEYDEGQRWILDQEYQRLVHLTKRLAISVRKLKNKYKMKKYSLN